MSVVTEMSEPHTMEQFYKYCAEEKLMAISCKKCNKIMIPPRPYCPDCSSSEGDWIQLMGTGTVLTYTIIHVAPQQFAVLTPYVVAIVRLTEGPSLPGMVKFVEPRSVKIGMKVQVAYEAATEDGWPRWSQYFFKPD